MSNSMKFTNRSCLLINWLAFTPIELEVCSSTVFPLTFWLIGKCSNLIQTIVPKAVKIRLCALNFTPIHYHSILKDIFSQSCRLFYIWYVDCIAKNNLPLIHQIADTLTKIDLEGILEFKFQAGLFGHLIVNSLLVTTSITSLHKKLLNFGTIRQRWVLPYFNKERWVLQN